MMKRLKLGLLQKLLFLAVAIFPFGISILFLGRRLMLDIGGYYLYLISSITLLAFVIYINAKFKDICSTDFYKKRRTLIDVIACLSLMLVAFLYRFYLMNEYPAPAVNDAIVAYDAAKNWMNGPSFSPAEFISQHWGIYAVLLSFVFKLFGSSLVVAKSVSIFAAVVSVAAIFYSVLIRSNKLILSITAGLFVALWPAFAMYVNFLSGDHIFLMFFSLAILTLTLVEKQLSAGNVNKYFGYLLLFASLMSIGGVFKEMSIITVPAALIVLIHMIIKNNKTQMKNAKLIISSSLIIVCLSPLITFASNNIVSHYAMGPVNTHKTGYFVATGLSSTTGGRYNEAIAKRFLDPIMSKAQLGQLNEQIYRDVDSQMFNLIRQEITQDANELPILFAKKIYTVWSNEDEINNWNYDAYTLNNIEPSNYSKGDLKNKLRYFNALSNCYMFIMMLLAFIGVLSFAFKKQIADSGVVFATLVIFGFSGALVVIEVMTRYRSILYVAISLLAVYGISFFSDCFSDKRLEAK